MGVVEFLFSLFSAVVATEKLAKYAIAFAGKIVLWMVESQTKENLAFIADAAALSARATNQEERREALKAWRAALSRPRVT